MVKSTGLNIIFMGTPEFAVPSLVALSNSRHRIIAVITQPDRRRDRGNGLVESPVKTVANSLGIRVLMFEKISREGADIIRGLCPDIMVTAAYGQILSQEIIDIAPYGIINVHASILPKYRGAAPIHWALINGERETGVTIMQTERGVDTGEMILAERVAVSDRDNLRTLTSRLSDAGVIALLNALDAIESGTAVKTVQNHSEATYYPMLSKKDYQIDFSMNSEDIRNRIRGLYPDAYTFFDGKRVKILEAEVVTATGEPGTVIGGNSGLTVACGHNALNIITLHPENAKAMPASEYLHGHIIKIISNKP